MTDWLSWARRHAVPLTSATASAGTLAQMIGDASLVALGEGEHCASEVLQCRNHLFRQLVREKRFTAIALESGLVEGRVGFEYVRGSKQTAADVKDRTFSWSMGRLPQNQALLRWMRRWNRLVAQDRKIGFYGFDISGSPGDSNARRGLHTAISEALAFLERADEAIARKLSERMKPLQEHLRFELRTRTNDLGYEDFTWGERDALTALIADLIAQFESCEHRYAAATSAEEFDWAYRSAINARQTDAWLRSIPLRWREQGEPFDFLYHSSELRDRAQADNIEWIVRREADNRGKTLLFAHNAHLSAAPIEWRYGAPASRRSDWHHGAGTYLRQRFGDDLVSIGSLIGRGSVGFDGFRQRLDPPAPDSLEGLGAAVGIPCFALDLRLAPPPIAALLSQSRRIGRGFEYPGKLSVTQAAAPGHAFDILLYFDRVSPGQAE